MSVLPRIQNKTAEMVFLEKEGFILEKANENKRPSARGEGEKSDVAVSER